MASRRKEVYLDATIKMNNHPKVKGHTYAVYHFEIFYVTESRSTPIISESVTPDHLLLLLSQETPRQELRNISPEPQFPRWDRFWGSLKCTSHVCPE